MAGESNTSESTWVDGTLEEVLELTRSGVTNWCNVINKMGMEKEDQQRWVTIFKDQIINLYKDMTHEVTVHQNVLLDEIEALLKKSEMLCKDLRIKMPGYGSEGLRLYEEQRFLKEKNNEYELLVEQRRKEIAKLDKKQVSLCRDLGRVPKIIPESPLPSQEYINEFKIYLDSLEDERYKRMEVFVALKGSIMELVEEINYKPTLDFEKSIISSDDSLFLVSDQNMKELSNFFEQLKKHRDDIKDQIASLREQVKYLWELLSEDLKTCNVFLENHTGTTVDTLEALKQEVKRCDALRRANIEVFVKRLRKELVDLWDKCHFIDQEREEFEYFHTDLYTEDLLTLHDMEIQKIKKYYAHNSDLFSLLAKRDELWAKMLVLEERATAPDRYKNRGGQLLREEKERNTLSKHIPQIEEQLIELANDFETRTGRRFLSWGETVETIISRAHEKHDKDRRLKLSARKHIRDKTLTPGKSMLGMTPCTSTQNLAMTPLVKSSKRKNLTPLFPSKRTRVIGEHNGNIPKTAPPKLTVNGHLVGPSRYSSERSKRIEKCRRISQRMALKHLQKENISSCSGSTQEYDIFEKEMEIRTGCRSTIFGNAGDMNEPLAQPLPSTPRTPAAGLNTPRRTPRMAGVKSPSSTASKLSTAPGLKLLF